MPQLNENVIHATQDGTACGRQGLEYELHMLMYLFINAFLHKLENFRMRFQIRDYDNEKKKPKEIGAFDDIVIRTENDEYILFQLKHKDITTKEPNKIQYSHLFPQNKSDFGIVKYIISYIKTKYCDTLKNYSDFTGKANKKNKIFKAVIYTNTIFNFDENNRISAQNPDEYIIADEFSINDLNHKVLTSFLSKGGKSYHKFSFNEIIRNIKDGKEISKLRKVIADCYKVEESEISEKQIEEEIEDASDHIIYAGNQPNYKTLRELTEKMIEQHFIIFDVNNFVQSLYKDLINWTSHKETFPPEITFENICNYFKPHFKFYYCLPDPITPFCENTEELFVLNVAAKVLIKCHDFLPLDSNSDNSINYMKCAMQEKLNLQSYNRVTNWISNKLWKHENDEHLIVELDSMLNNLRKLGKSNACKVIPEILMKSYNRLKLPNNSSFLKSFIMTNIINNDWTVTLPKIIVSGDCGLGKSELILRLIDILKRENYFDIIIRISAESENSVMNSLQQVALKLNRKSNCSGDTIENTVNIINCFDGLKVLFVFVNCPIIPSDNRKGIISSCFRQMKSWRIKPLIIMSTTYKETEHNAHFLSLKPCKRKSLDFIKQSFNFTSNLHDSLVKQFAKKFNYNTYAIQLAISFINQAMIETFIDQVNLTDEIRIRILYSIIQGYFEEFHFFEQSFKNIYDSFKIENHFERIIFNNFKITIEKLSRKNLDGINAILLLESIKNYNTNKFERDVFLSILVDSDLAEKALNILIEYSLLKKIDDSSYEIHYLLRKFLQIESKIKKKTSSQQNYFIIPTKYIRRAISFSLQFWKFFCSLSFINKAKLY